MEKFIVDRVKAQAGISIEKGQEKYRAYFVNTSIYAKYQTAVDDILTTEGYAACIVTE